MVGFVLESLMLCGSIFNSFVCSATAVNLSSPTLFRSWKSTRLASHLRTTIVEAARATSAAPTFFRSIDIVGDEGLPETFVDGGMLANNPVKFVLNQAKEIFPNSNIDYILSLGTGGPSVIKIDVNDSIFKGLLPTNIILVKALARIATDCESTADEVEGKFSDTPGVYYRLNVNRGLEEVSLSEWTKSNSVASYTRAYLDKEDVHRRVLKLVQKLYQAPSLGT
jgi:predicted acylesterase/phospholipase RssA